MMNRREALGVVGSSLGIPALASSPCKSIDADPSVGFLVVELSPESDYASEEQYERIAKKVGELTGLKVLVVPPGVKVKAVPSGGAFLRERLGEYEVEIVAKDEATLRDRYLKMFPSNDLHGRNPFDEEAK